MSDFKQNIISILETEYNKSIKTANTVELYNAVSKAALDTVKKKWNTDCNRKKACYLSAEFLIGRLLYSNLMNMGLLDELNSILNENGIDINIFEDIEDAALGNGGLGRLAACFLDSAATHDIPLNGYGIRYRYGLFKQHFENGFQAEAADNWLKFGDPWSVRRDDEKVSIVFDDQIVYAVPYDTPVIGYNSDTVNTLRLWQAESVSEFNFDMFNRQQYDLAVKEKNSAEAISYVLYPNDDTDEGKKLRLKQQYFFSSASIQNMLKKYKTKNSDFSHFSDEYAIQLNDTHPVVAIPEFVRLLVMENNVSLVDALKIAKATFAYTNHTIMAEALEKWNVNLFKSVIPNVYYFIVAIDKALQQELEQLGIKEEKQQIYRIIDNNTIHMARLAIYATHSTNGVAKIHTDIIKNTALNEWYRIYPERFNNKTNGITQRRWLALSNKELSSFITEKIGDSWVKDLTKLKELEKYKDDRAVIDRFAQIKQTKKEQLAKYIKKYEDIKIDTSFIFDIQIKRLHEYKRQLLNAFSILDIYYGIKDGRIKNFNPTLFIFGAKSAPGYFRAKGIIKYINEIAKLIDNDKSVNDKIQVLFVSNYNVSYAEKLIPAADISEQISTAGTEASGTSNMKFMLNGAVTLGTLDGANVEIVAQSGQENNYIFGAKVEDIESMKGSYNPKALYNENIRIKRVVDSLVDGTFNDSGSGMFQELYNSILNGASWHRADNYFLLYDFIPYCDEKLKVNADYSDKYRFTQKCFINTANAGIFSSDRTVKQYADEIWGL